MELQKATLGGSAAIFTAVAAAALYVGTTISTISVGGPIVANNQQASDLVADILPPPVYILESYLEARLAMVEPGKLDMHVQRLEQLRNEYGARQEHWRASTLPQRLKGQLQKVDAPADRFFAELQAEFLPSLKRGDQKASALSIRKLGAAYTDHRREIDRLVEQTAAYQVETREGGESYVSFAFWSMAFVGMALAIVLAVANVLLSRFAITPLKSVAGTMRRMAEGDLDAKTDIQKPVEEIGEMMSAIEVFRASSKARLAAEQTQAFVVRELTSGLDALANKNLAYRIEASFPGEYDALRLSFNQTTHELCDVLGQTSASASNVLTGAAEIKTASNDLALRTEQQAASLEESAAAMREVTSMVQQTAQNAAAVGTEISEAHVNTLDGGKVVQRAVDAMGAIQKSANEITSIIDVIDAIAFQTNLLALNAGVEAARAGEAGKGFAVVATEVRALAQRSADAARDIKQLISASNASVNEGVDLVDQTGTVLVQIGARVATINDRIAEMAQSAKTQAARLQQVNDAVGDMDKMTQQNAAMVEESNAAARSLTDEATELAELVQAFQTGQATVAIAASQKSNGARRSNYRAPVITGNLAVRIDHPEDDWSEF